WPWGLQRGAAPLATEQLAGFSQVWCLEPFREPLGDRSQQFASFLEPWGSMCHTRSVAKCARIAPPIPMRRYHMAHAMPTNALREAIQTQVRSGTLSNPPKRNTAAGACKTANSSELTDTAIRVPLLDAGRMRSKALSKNSRHRISSPKEAVALARSEPQKDDGCNTSGSVCGSARLINAIAPTRPRPQSRPVLNAQAADKPKRSGRFLAQMALSSGAGPGLRARARRSPARANKP